MKNINQTLQERYSIRKYTDEHVSDTIIENALHDAQRTGTSINGQQVSVITIRDKKVLEKLAEISWGQKHVKEANIFLMFVVDYNRPAGVMKNKIGFVDDIESILVGAVDAGLVAQSVELLLTSQGLGTCIIGGIRNDIIKTAEILNITGKAIPVLGMSIGYTTSNVPKEKLRPRVDFESFSLQEKYDIDKVQSGAIKYDQDLTKWWEAKQLSGHRSYQESMDLQYSETYIPEQFANLQKLGFLSKYQEKK